MPTKTRSATGKAQDTGTAEAVSAKSAGPGRKAASTIRAARDPLKATADEAKRNSAAAKGEAASLEAVVTPSDSVGGSQVKALAKTAPKQDKSVDPQPIDPAAARKAAAAFVAARRKMAQPATAAAGLNSSDASKGTDQVIDKMVGKATLDTVAAEPVATPVAPAPVAPPHAPMAQRPFSAMQRGGPGGIKARPAPSPKGQVFKTGEFIVYPAHGVGQITATETQEVAGYKLELFVISFVKDKMILKVPLPKIASVGMRKLAEPPVMKRALDTLTGRARVKRTMWSRRAQEYEAKINSGDLVAIAEVVRDLYRSDAQPEQSYSERQLYEAALDRMARELGVVHKLTDTEALKMIDDQLQKGPRRGKAEEADADDADDSEDSGIVEAA